MQLKRIGIIGAGRMGIPMAFTAALSGYAVDLGDLKPRSDAQWVALCSRAEADWTAATDLLTEVAAVPPPVARPWHNITIHRGAGPWLEAADCLFEALPEIIEVKAAGYKEAGRWLKKDCLVGSTTSSFTPDDLAGNLLHPERFMVTHWLHPPWLMPLVEVAPGTATRPDAMAAMLALLQKLGKVPIAVAGTPGLIVARLQIPIMNAAARLAGEGVASAATVDQAVRLGLGLRFIVQGLLEFADTGGVDVLYLSSKRLQTALQDPAFEPAPAVAELTQKGELGRKSGQGFYRWNTPEMEKQASDALKTYLRLLKMLGLMPGATGAAGN